MPWKNTAAVWETRKQTTGAPYDPGWVEGQSGYNPNPKEAVMGELGRMARKSQLRMGPEGTVGLPGRGPAWRWPRKSEGWTRRT